MFHTTLINLIQKDIIKTQNGCVEYRKNLRAGYGRVRYKGKLYSAHRVVLEAWEQRPSEQHVALHSCDNPPCISVLHLRWGTQADNTADAIARGRYVKMIGTTNGRAKISDSDVIEIRKLSGTGPTQRQIGEKFGISNQTVSNIITKKSWKHLIS